MTIGRGPRGHTPSAKEDNGNALEDGDTYRRVKLPDGTSAIFAVRARF